MRKRDNPDEVSSIQEAVQSTADKQLELDDFCRLLDHSRACTINFKEWAEKKGHSQMTNTRDQWYKLYDIFADETDIKHKYTSIGDYAEAVFGDSDDEAYFKSFIRDKHPEINDTMEPVRISDLNKAYDEFMESKKPKPVSLEELLNKHVPKTLHEEFLLYLIKHKMTEFNSESSFLHHYNQWKEQHLPSYKDVLACKGSWENRIASNQTVDENPVLSFCMKHELAYFDLTNTGKFVRFNQDKLLEWYESDGLTLSEYCAAYLSDTEPDKVQLFKKWVESLYELKRRTHNDWFMIYKNFSSGYEDYKIDANMDFVENTPDEKSDKSDAIDKITQKYKINKIKDSAYKCDPYTKDAIMNLLDYLEWEFGRKNQ